MSTAGLWAAAGCLFFIGAAFLLLRRQLLAMLIGVELMINAANLALVYYALRRADAKALAVALLVIAVAAAEAVIGLSLIVALRGEGLEAETGRIRELAG